MSLEEKLKEYMTELPVPEQLRPENIMSSIQPRIEALPQISDEKSFLGENAEISAIEFLTKLQRMGLSAEDFVNLLRGNGVSDERIKPLAENPYMSADELCDFLDSCGFTAQAYTKMLYLARKLWLQTQSLEHLDTELLLHAKNNAEASVQPAEPIITKRKSVSERNGEPVKSAEHSETAQPREVYTAEQHVNGIEASGDYVEENSEHSKTAQSREVFAAEQRINTDEEEIENPQISEPVGDEARAKIRPISRIRAIIERVDDTVIIDDDELNDAQERQKEEHAAVEAKRAAAAEEKRKEDEIRSSEENQDKSRRRNNIFKGLSAAAAAVVLLFGAYEYTKLPSGSLTESDSAIQQQSEDENTVTEATYDLIYAKMSELKADTLGEREIPSAPDTAYVEHDFPYVQLGGISKNGSDGDILTNDGKLLYCLTANDGKAMLHALTTENGEIPNDSAVAFTASAAEMALTDSGICIVTCENDGKSTVVRLLEKQTLKELKRTEISGTPLDMLVNDGKLTLVTSYTPAPDAAYTANDYDSYLPFYSTDGTAKYIEPESIFIPDSVAEPVFAVVANIDLNAENPLTDISACMMRADVICMNGEGILLAENSYPTSLLYYNSIGFKGAVRLDGTVSYNCLNISGDKIRAVTCLSTATQTDKITLHIFDGQLKAVSRIENIATGEAFERAYFNGSTACIVTNRAENPLFTVETSDPSKPIITGEMALPKFTAKLCGFDDTSLLGFGFVKDNNGNLVSLKLSILDADDGVTEKATLVIEGIPDLSLCSTEAETNPHALLIDRENSLIGFMYSYFDGISTVNNYALAKYSDGALSLIGTVNNYDNEAFRRGTIKDGILYALYGTTTISADTETMRFISTRSLEFE